MSICIKRFISIICFLAALISNADAHDMTIQEKLLQRQEDAARKLQENQSSRTEELQEYQEEAAEDLNQVDVRKHRKRERRQEKVFDHRPVFKDDLYKYNRTRKKDF